MISAGGVPQRDHSRAEHLIKLGELAMSSERYDDEHTVELFGELDLATTDKIQQELERVEATDAASILIDLSGLTFMDSSGIRLLWTAYGRSRADANRLSLLRGTAPVQRVLRLTDLEHRLPFVD